MVETESKPKKVVGRTVAIVLVTVCMVLSAGLIATVAVYLPTASTIDRLNSENSGLGGNVTVLTQQVADLQNTIAQRESSLSSRDNQISNLTEEVNNLLDVLYLNAAETPIPSQEFSLLPSENLTIWSGTINYAGYFTVSVESSSNTTFVQLTYASYGVNFDQTMVVGTSGTGSFPVLPTDDINIILGNAELVDSVNGTVIVTYVY